MDTTELDLAIERMNKAVDTAVLGILHNIVSMVDTARDELIDSISPTAMRHLEKAYRKEIDDAFYALHKPRMNWSRRRAYARKQGTGYRSK